MCSLVLSGDSYLYSFGNEERVFVESRLAPYYLASPWPKWKIVACRKQKKELIRNYDYVPNRLQHGGEIYRRHLELKAKSQQ